MFTSRIRAVRLKLELTLKEVGEGIKIPLSTVCKYEQGVIKPGLNILARYGNVYNVNMNYLVLGKGRMFIK